MKAIKTILFLFVIFTFIQCNKDAEVEPIVRILPNGKYSFSDGGGASLKFYLLDNFLYSYHTGENEFCFEKPAGQIFKIGDSVFLPTLFFHGYYSNKKCMFSQEYFGGDTFVYHLSRIHYFQNNNSMNGLKGSYFYNVQSGLPFSKYEGTFILNFISNQN
ncbi:MAG: hypothetical protein Q8R57_00070 [Bacteroidota bacterium]|nr:hypothetical protein [Bacteroidota bacterium]